VSGAFNTYIKLVWDKCPSQAARSVTHLLLLVPFRPFREHALAKAIHDLWGRSSYEEQLERSIAAATSTNQRLHGHSRHPL